MIGSTPLQFSQIRTEEVRVIIINTVHLEIVIFYIFFTMYMVFN